jgi:chorismate mutase/prephenate dehydrogenase
VSTKSDESIHALRGRIDAVDHQILKLLAQRMEIVSELAAVKRESGVRVRDEAREARVLDDRKAVGTQLGLASELVESLYRLIMWWSRDQQAALRVEVPLDMDPKTIAIVGGQGAMGARMAQMLGELGHTVLISDVATPLTPREAAARADVTIVAVPISVTEQVIAEVGPHVPPHGLLMDITSIKTAPMDAMLEATRASVVGTHPMFGPGVHSLQGQRMVLCPGRGDAWLAWARKTFEARGLVVTEAAADEHDRAMALVQVLTHYQTQVLGLTLARLGSPLHESLKFTSPAYLMELYVAARHFGQEPALYGPIEMNNPLTERVTDTFRAAASTIRDMLVQRDQARFAAMFDEVRAFFGEFSQEATEKSSFMMDRLVERS